MKISKKQLHNEVIKICAKILKRREGALIIIGDNVDYTPMHRKKISEFNIIDDLPLVETLALRDGAVIISNKGKFLDYGAKVKSDKSLTGFGTRTEAGYSASFNKDTISYVCSEEDNVLRIFKLGKMIPFKNNFKDLKDIEKKANKISSIILDIGNGLTSGTGAGIVVVLTSLIGFTGIPSVLIFGGSFGTFYYLIKDKLINKL
jgi:hypothetical protein